MSNSVRTTLAAGIAVIFLAGILTPFPPLVSSRFPELKLLLSFALVICAYFFVRGIMLKKTSNSSEQQSRAEILSDATLPVNKEQDSEDSGCDNLLTTAYFDALTGLPNRTLAINRLSHEMSRARREKTKVAVMLLGIEGQETSDNMLKILAFRLTRCLRESDVIARISSDEFAIILPDINHDIDVEVSVRRVLNVFAEPFIAGAMEYDLTAGIGITIFPADGASPEELLGNAWEGMLRAREEGSNSFQFFSHETGASIEERRKIQSSLLGAMERQEMRVYYQPQIDLFRRTVGGVEALVRWQHPECGLIGPEKFISVAEETGVIGKIDEWVLRTACMQLKTWMDAGFPPMHVSLNVSPHNFLQQNFLKMIVSVLADTGLSPDQLTMEITEFTAIRNIEQTCEIMQTLNNMGVRISIDNFGTGYSSLYYLKRFPIQTLKIDSSFIHDVTHNSDSAIIVKAIIAMARSMKRKVVAVGVETFEQLDFLRAQHCDAVQGEIFGDPLPAEEFQLLLEQHVWDNSMLSIH